MKKVSLIIGVVLAVSVLVSCSGQKKCPAYSKANNTEVKVRS